MNLKTPGSRQFLDLPATLFDTGFKIILMTFHNHSLFKFIIIGFDCGYAFDAYPGWKILNPGAWLVYKSDNDCGSYSNLDILVSVAGLIAFRKNHGINTGFSAKPNASHAPSCHSSISTMFAGRKYRVSPEGIIKGMAAFSVYERGRR